jgi:hypothetical protein
MAIFLFSWLFLISTFTFSTHAERETMPDEVIDIWTSVGNCLADMGRRNVIGVRSSEEAEGRWRLKVSPS